jgi:hypothetical protein
MCDWQDETSRLSNQPSTRSNRIGALIHSDVCGSMQVQSMGKASYYVLFHDDSSGYRVLRFTKHKSEVADCLKKTSFNSCMLRMVNWLPCYAQTTVPNTITTSSRSGWGNGEFTMRAPLVTPLSRMRFREGQPHYDGRRANSTSFK